MQNSGLERREKIIKNYGNLIIAHALLFLIIMTGVIAAEYKTSGLTALALSPFILLNLIIGYGFKKKKIWAFSVVKSSLYIIRLGYPIGYWIAKKALADFNKYNIRELMTW